MTPEAWIVVIAQGVAIVGLVLLYWRTKDERDAAREALPQPEWAGLDAFLLNTSKVATMEIAHVGPLTIDGTAKMPANDSDVLREMGVRGEHCYTVEALASFAGTSNGHRMVGRLLNAGLLEMCIGTARERRYKRTVAGVEACE